MAAENLRKVKILVLGDTGEYAGRLCVLVYSDVCVMLCAGVGKTSLVHLVCHQEVLTSLTWTIGCNVEVKVRYTPPLEKTPTPTHTHTTHTHMHMQLHDYGPSPSTSSSYFVELWDIGGSPSHKNGRQLFYQNTNGR